MTFPWVQRLSFNSKFWTETLAFVCFLGLATAIWYGHAMGSVRSATIAMPVQYTGVPEDVLFSDTLPVVVNVEIRDAGRRLKAYHLNPPTLIFDLENQINGDNGKIFLSADVVRNAVVALVQGTSKVQNVTPEVIQAAYFRQYSKSVPVRLRCQVTPAPQYQLVGETQAQTNTVTIFGDKRQLDSIDYIATQFLLVEDVRDTMILTTSLEVPEGLRVNTPDINVQVIAEPFTEKKLTLPILTRNVPHGTQLRLFPNTVDVVLRVGVAHFADIQDSDIKVFCNYPSRPTDKLPVQVECLCPYVTFTRCTPASVEFLIEK